MTSVSTNTVTLPYLIVIVHCDSFVFMLSDLVCPVCNVGLFLWPNSRMDQDATS